MNTLSFSYSKTNAKRSKRGFSLVEVSISLGLVGFALVSVLGVLPTGLTTLRESMNQTVEAQILQSIASRAVTSHFTNLNADTLHFDDEGLPLAVADVTSKKVDPYYTVNLAVADPSFPGSDNVVALPESLKNLVIQIITRPNQVAARSERSYSIHVANSGN